METLNQFEHGVVRVVKAGGGFKTTAHMFRPEDGVCICGRHDRSKLITDVEPQDADMVCSNCLKFCGVEVTIPLAATELGKKIKKTKKTKKIKKAKTAVDASSAKQIEILNEVIAKRDERISYLCDILRTAQLKLEFYRIKEHADKVNLDNLLSTIDDSILF